MAWLVVACAVAVLLVLDAGAAVVLLVRRDVFGGLRAVAVGVGLYWFVVGALRRTVWVAGPGAGEPPPRVPSARRLALSLTAAAGCALALVVASVAQILLGR